MSQYALMSSYLKNRSVDHRASQKWAKERNQSLGDNFFSSQFFKMFENFNKQYDEWLTELKTNHIAFRPFHDDGNITDVLEKIDGYKPKYSFWPFTKKSYDYIDERLSKNISKIQKNLDAPQTFMELFYITTSEVTTNKLKI